MSPAALAGVAIRRNRVLDVLPARRRHRQRIDDRVHDIVADAVVLEHEPEDRDEHDRQRCDREQHPVGDPGGMLRTLISEESLDRVRDDSGDLLRDRSGPPQRT